MMHTAEEYFAALEEALRQMPASERDETITYYREYAQEGGLLDGEQLREHFGPPEALAARILEDNAGKRSQENSQHGGSMDRRVILVLLGIFVVVVALGSILISVLRPQNGIEDALSAESVSQNDVKKPQPTDTSSLSDTEEASGGLSLHYDDVVNPFTEIAIDVVSAEITVEIGNDYALRYDLSDQEIVDRAGVEGETLYLVSHNKPGQDSKPWYGEVCITVPAGTDLGNLHFSTVSGGVTVPELSCDSIQVDNVSGNSELNCMAANNVTVNSTSGSVQFGGQCQRLSVDATSGKLTFTGKADAVLLDTTAGELNFTGTANSVEMDSTSGNAQIEGNVTEQVQIDMVSGDIVVVTNDPTVTAEGKRIDYNGQRVAEDSWSRQGSGCTLTLETTAGSISINNP